MKSGGQPGNQNAVKNRPWQDAINRALARFGEGSYDGGLNALADELIKKCVDGDMTAIKELGDRLEGKAPQALIHQGDEERPIETITRTLIKS